MLRRTLSWEKQVRTSKSEVSHQQRVAVKTVKPTRLWSWKAMRNKTSDLDLSGVHDADTAADVQALRMSFGIRKGTQSCIDTMQVREKRMAVDLLSWIHGELGSLTSEIPGFGSTRSAWINGFTDGRVFCALIYMHGLRNPSKTRALALDLQQIDMLPDADRLNLAFHAAHQLGIPPLLSVRDMTHGYAGARAIMTYVAMLRLGLSTAEAHTNQQPVGINVTHGLGSSSSASSSAARGQCDTTDRLRSVSPSLPSDSEDESTTLDSNEVCEVMATAETIMLTTDKQAREDALLAQRHFLRLAESAVSEDES